MKTISFNVPNEVNIDAKEAAMILAAHLYEKGTLSLGQAAETAGLSKKTFAELLGRYGVSLFNYPAAELENDVEAA